LDKNAQLLGRKKRNKCGLLSKKEQEWRGTLYSEIFKEKE